MSVFKEINKADGSGVTQFFRLSTEKQTVETNDYGDFYNFKGGVASRKDLPTTKLETGDAYFIEDEEKTVFWDGTAWREINAYVLNYNYNDASNKPLINGHVLSGDKSAAELELQPAGDYLTEIPEEYITEKELADLDLADKNYVIDQINNTEHFHREIVDGLPVIGKDNVIYMIKKKSASGDDIYDEWMWVDTKYEHIGSTAADLSDYYKKEEANKLLDKKVDKVTGKGLSSNNYTTAEKTKLASLENYDDTAIKAELATFHNYDDTDIKNDITSLKTAENGLKTDVKDIKEDLKDKIEGVRLVRSGDMWDFYTVGGTRLTYETARELLGHPNTILYMEGVENDGKTTPADYDIDEELIHVHYMDEDGEDRYLQMGYPNTASAEGSYIYIEDAVAQPLNSLTVEGKTEQKTTTGKNLLDYISNLRISTNGLTNVINSDGSITTSGKPSVNYSQVTQKKEIIDELEDGQTYTISQAVANRVLYLEVAIKSKDGTYTYLSCNLPERKSVTFTVDKNVYVSYIITVQTTTTAAFGDSSLTITNKYMLCKGTDTADTSFEPYVGGQPSPNPDYPQEIENIRGVENLLKLPDGTYESNDIIAVIKDGVITLNGTATANSFINVPFNYNFIANKEYTLSAHNSQIVAGECYIRLQKNNTVYFPVRLNSVNSEYSINFSENLTVETFNIRTEKGKTYNNFVIKPQLEEDTVIHDFVPYGSNYLKFKNHSYNFWKPCYNQTFQGITLTQNDDGSILLNGTATANTFFKIALDETINEATTLSCDYKSGTISGASVYIRTRTSKNIINHSIDIGPASTQGIKLEHKTAENYYQEITIQKNAVLSNVLLETMLLKGTYSVAELPIYEPYKSESTLIDLKGNELCSLPNGTKDELIIENNRVKINKKIGKVVLNGKNNKVIMIGLHNGSRYVTANIYNNSIAKIPEAAVIYTISDKLRGASLASTWAGKEYFTVSQANNGTYLQLCLPQSYKDLSFTTQESINNYLAANPITTYFLLAKPETIDLGEIDMPATFEGINNITVSGSLSPNIKIKYTTNVNYFDRGIGFKNHYIGYYENVANLPAGDKGDIATVTSDKRIYINDGNGWIPSDKNSTIDLSNYLAKDNTTGYAPTGNYNPATKKYVDDSVKGINIPTKTSQLTNDSNFVIKTTNELTNYYTKNNTYTKTEVNALVAGGSGGDSKIETLDITGGKDITALLTPGTHLYYLQGGEEDDLTLYAYYRDRDSYDTIHLYSGTLISVDYYVEAGDGEIHILYIDPQQGFGWLEYYGTPTKRTKLTNASVYDVGYIKASTNKLIANLLSNRINVVTEDTTISVYLNGSTSLTDLLLPTNTILIGKGIEFSGVMNTGGLIIKPDMTMYTITTSPLANLKVSELKLVTSDILTSTLSNYATESYADNCKLENAVPVEGTDIFGWYATTQDGAALTHATPQMIESIAIGEVYEWPSNVYVDGTNSAVVTSITKSYDHWSATRASGGESNYKEFIVYMGNHNVYTFAFDDTTVYKNYYPGDK